MNKIEQLKELKALYDANAINKEQYDFMVDEIVKGKSSEGANSGRTQIHASNKTPIEEFSSVIIEYKEWMTENLRVKHFRNGDLIPEVTTFKQFKEAEINKSPAFCYYDDDPANEEYFGLLYNRYALVDERGLAPEGWSIPCNYDFEHLVNSFENELIASKYLRSRDLWDSDWRGVAGGTNKSGFNARPGGHASEFNGFCFSGKGTECIFWGIDTKNKDSLSYLSLSNDGLGVSFGCLSSHINTSAFVNHIKFGSVRCIKTSDTNPTGATEVF